MGEPFCNGNFQAFSETNGVRKKLQREKTLTVKTPLRNYIQNERKPNRKIQKLVRFGLMSESRGEATYHC